MAPDAKPNPTRRTIAGQVVAATGFPQLSEGMPCEIQFSVDTIFVVELVTGTTVTELTYAEITDLRVSGSGRTTTTRGGGWIGGGRGVEVALEGAAIAGMLNKLTTRSTTSIDTRVELQAGGRALWLVHRKVTPAILQVRLAPVFARINAARSRGT